MRAASSRWRATSRPMNRWRRWRTQRAVPASTLRAQSSATGPVPRRRTRQEPSTVTVSVLLGLSSRRTRFASSRTCASVTPGLRRATIRRVSRALWFGVRLQHLRRQPRFRSARSGKREISRHDPADRAARVTHRQTRADRCQRVARRDVPRRPPADDDVGPVSVSTAACPNSAGVPSTSKNRSVTSAAGTTELSTPDRTVTSRL